MSSTLIRLVNMVKKVSDRLNPQSVAVIHPNLAKILFPNHVLQETGYER